jgi:DNA-binding NarL/FixJ family response regulator
MRRAKSRILIVDGHPIVQKGYQAMIHDQPDLTVCGVSSTLADALREVEQNPPDLIITDLTLPGGGGLELIKTFLRARPETKILVISLFDEMLYAPRALRAGASGFIPKNCDLPEVLAAIRRALANGVAIRDCVSAKMIGGSPDGFKGQFSSLEKLTDREFDVFQLFAAGRTIKEAAGILRLSPKTVAVHRENMKGRLNFGSSAELLHFAVRWAETQKFDGA